MPPKPRDYNEGKIYKIDVDGKLYVGHNIQPFRVGFNSHKKDSKKRPDGIPKLYSAIKERGGWDGLQMELVENYPCKNIDELKSRERHWIRQLQSELNTYIPLRTEKERYYENHEEEKQKWRELREENKEEINARRREIFSSPEGKARKAEYDRKYRDNHKEQLKQKKKEWSIKNAEKIKEHRSRDEYKQKRNETRRNTIHHCDICNVDIRGAMSAFKTHCLRPCHIEKSKNIV
jgi:hypothetical protein